MEEMILEFLRDYKKLDELCKQVLGSTRGVSEYIDQMQSEYGDSSRIVNWNKDLKELKRLRWIRNQLVHEADSFDTMEITKEDLIYLKEFRSRILNCEDPFALLRNEKKRNMHKNNRDGVSAFDADREKRNIAYSDDAKPKKFIFGVILLLVIILVLLVLLFILV